MFVFHGCGKLGVPGPRVECDIFHVYSGAILVDTKSEEDTREKKNDEEE